MKQYWFGSLVIALAFVLGAGAMWAYQESRQPEVLSQAGTQEFLDNMFNDDFFSRSRDPFREIERMRKHMDEVFRDDGFSIGFDRWFDRKSAFDVDTIEQQEDENTISYRLNVEDQDVVDMKANVEDGYVSIEAKLKRQTNTTVAESQFARRFPLPVDADPDSLVIDRDKEDVIIRFDKRKS